MALNCKIKNCKNKIYAKGLCNTHYLREWVKNNPEVVFKSRWTNMLNRCNNVNSKSYKYYGKRGINVCEKWLNYNNFKRDMYSSFNVNLSLDRINNNKGYSKNNCRWTTANIQNNNTRRNCYIKHDGIIKTFSEWCRFLRLKRNTVSQRFYCYNWDLNRSFNYFIKGDQIGNSN